MKPSEFDNLLVRNDWRRISTCDYCNAVRWVVVDHNDWHCGQCEKLLISAAEIEARGGEHLVFAQECLTAAAAIHLSSEIHAESAERDVKRSMLLAGVSLAAFILTLIFWIRIVIES